MSMFDDVMGIGRSSVLESMNDETYEPEIEATSLEEAADIEGDVMDFALQMAYENEMNMMKLDAAIVAEEYIYLRENGQEMVAEAGKLDTIISKAKGMVQSAWNKIQSFFKEVMKKIDETLKLDDRFIEKYEKKAAGNVAEIRGNLKLLDIDTIVKDAKDEYKDIADVAKIIFGDAVDSEKSVYYTKGDVDQIFKSIVKGDNGETSVSFANNLKNRAKAIKGDKDKTVKVEGSKAIAAFRKTKDAKKELKDAYTSNKKIINDLLKGLKKYETACKKFKLIPTAVSKNIHGSVKATNRCLTYLTMLNRFYVKNINQCRSFCKAAIVQAAAKSAPGAATESTSLIDALEF